MPRGRKGRAKPPPRDAEEPGAGEPSVDGSTAGESSADDSAEEPSESPETAEAGEAVPAAPLPEAGPLEPPEPTFDQRARLVALLDAVEDAERVLVLTHDNPDPDALASAAGLAFLLEKAAGVTVEVAFGGIIGRAENRALLQELGRPFQRADGLGDLKGATIALVDTQPRTGNNSLPPGRIATVVIDHHPPRPESAAASFADIRPEYGASSSMVVEYLRAAALEPDRKLATGLFYGVQSETMDLGREVSAADLDASVYLYPRSDPAAVARIRHARVPATYFRSLYDALAEARRHGNVIVVPLGRMDYPDMVAEVADLFMHVEGVEWAIAVGRYGDRLLLSVRTYAPNAHAGELVRSVIGERGTAGGHGGLAGGQLDLHSLSDAEAQEFRNGLILDFLAELGAADEPPEPLIAPAAVSGAPEEAESAGEAG